MSELVDSLTGLATPSILRERANWLLTRRMEDQRPFGVLQLDVSGFAGINAQYGVSVGDSILVMAADRMLTSVRPSDLVGRLGNDDFQLIFNDGLKSIADLKVSVDRVLAALHDEYDLAGLSIRIRFKAAGLLVGVPHPKAESIYRRADEAVALAKQESRVVLEPF